METSDDSEKEFEIIPPINLNYQMENKGNELFYQEIHNIVTDMQHYCQKNNLPIFNRHNSVNIFYNSIL